MAFAESTHHTFPRNVVEFSGFPELHVAKMDTPKIVDSPKSILVVLAVDSTHSFDSTRMQGQGVAPPPFPAQTAGQNISDPEGQRVVLTKGLDADVVHAALKVRPLGRPTQL